MKGYFVLLREWLRRSSLRCRSLRCRSFVLLTVDHFVVDLCRFPLGGLIEVFRIDNIYPW